MSKKNGVIQLPTERTKVSTNAADCKILLYGPPKIGKSTAAARIPGALFIPTEAGLNFLSVAAMPVVETWEGFLETCRVVMNERHDYTTLVIDVVDRLYELYAKHIAKEKGKEDISDIGYGKGYAMASLTIMNVLTRLARSKMGLVLISHAISTEHESRTGKVYIKWAPSISVNIPGKKPSQSFHTQLTGLADSILFATQGVDGAGKAARVVRSIGTPYYEAGGRNDMFPDGMLLDDLFVEKKNKKEKNR